MQLTLLHSESFAIAPYADALRAESISARSVPSLDHVGVDGVVFQRAAGGARVQAFFGMQG